MPTVYTDDDFNGPIVQRSRFSRRFAPWGERAATIQSPLGIMAAVMLAVIAFVVVWGLVGFTVHNWFIPILRPRIAKLFILDWNHRWWSHQPVNLLEIYFAFLIAKRVFWRATGDRLVITRRSSWGPVLAILLLASLPYGHRSVLMHHTETGVCKPPDFVIDGVRHRCGRRIKQIDWWNRGGGSAAVESTNSTVRRRPTTTSTSSTTQATISDTEADRRVREAEAKSAAAERAESIARDEEALLQLGFASEHDRRVMAEAMFLKSEREKQDILTLAKEWLKNHPSGTMPATMFGTNTALTGGPTGATGSVTDAASASGSAASGGAAPAASVNGGNFNTGSPSDANCNDPTRCQDDPTFGESGHPGNAAPNGNPIQETKGE